MDNHYIYLLQEREFIKTNEKIFKIGKTKQENLKRFANYPNGSKLLFQCICINCDDIERDIITSFKDLFIHKKEVGNEYFEGDYIMMIDIIYTKIQEYKNCCKKYYDKNETKNDFESEGEGECEGEGEVEPQIITYEEWKKYTHIDNVIITNKNTKEGYIRFKNQLWRKLSNPDDFAYDNDIMENLSDFIEAQQHSSKDYNTKKIIDDIVNKCYIKKVDYVKLKYNEHIVVSWNCKYQLFNAITFTFEDIDTYIQNKINPLCYGERYINIYENINADIIENIFTTLINEDIKIKYKELHHNIFKNQKEKIIFYDYGCCLLSDILTDIMYSILGSRLYIRTDKNTKRSEIKEHIKKYKPRCVIYTVYTPDETTTIEKNINYYSDVGFKNIVIQNKYANKNIYNLENCKKYLFENKEKIYDFIKNQDEEYNNTNYNFINKNSLDNVYELFYGRRYLFTNLIKWCLVD